MDQLPHELYLKFLVTLGMSHEEANTHLSELSLPSCREEYWNQLYTQLHESKIPKEVKSFWNKPKNKFPKDFFSYMNTLGLKSAWMYNMGKNPDFDKAIDIVQDESIGLTVKALLTSRLALDEISALINGKYGVSFPKASVGLFEAFLWDVRKMPRTAWRKLLPTLPNHEQGIIHLALSGEEKELRVQLGLPLRISISEHYQKLHVLAMSKFDIYSRSSAPNADTVALKWAQLAMSAGDKYEKLKLGDATDFSRDIQMEFDFIDTEFPMVGSESLDEIQESVKKGRKNDETAPIILD